jgi:hypothetical protein
MATRFSTVGKKPGETAKVFNALAESIGVLSFAPGGVTAFGNHWESWHPEQLCSGEDDPKQSPDNKEARQS